jgi:hypothetical protein
VKRERKKKRRKVGSLGLYTFPQFFLIYHEQNWTSLLFCSLFPDIRNLLSLWFSS